MTVKTKKTPQKIDYPVINHRKKKYKYFKMFSIKIILGSIYKTLNDRAKYIKPYTCRTIKKFISSVIKGRSKANRVQPTV